jgi:hypothetical protein
VIYKLFGALCIEVVRKAPDTPIAITANGAMFFKNNVFIILNIKLNFDLLFYTGIRSPS